MKSKSRNLLKVAVIGTINRDSVTRPGGSHHEGYGGILYNLAVLSALAPKNTIIFPVANIGRDCSQQILRRLRVLPRLNLSGLRIVEKPNNHCILRYHDEATKTEVLKGWVGGVGVAQLRTVVGADIVLVNFISGSDISGSSLRWLRTHCGGLIFMDFHSRTLGRHRDGSRFLRKPRDWREFLLCADIAQMNELEFRLLSGEAAGETACKGFMRRHFAKTSRCLIVTCGADGCLVTRREGAAIRFSSIPAPRIAEVVDTTGCGDIFSAGFIAEYLKTGNEISAAQFATRLASRRAAFGDFFALDLKRILPASRR